MTRRILNAAPGTNVAPASGIVADGRERLITAVESDARRIVEKKYADQWNKSGTLARWRLQRLMDAEITALVSKTMPDVSPDALF
jgi:hypothetical protein